MTFWIRRALIAVGSLVAAGLSVWLIAALAAPLLGVALPWAGTGTGSVLVDVAIVLLGGAIYADIVRRESAPR